MSFSTRPGIQSTVATFVKPRQCGYCGQDIKRNQKRVRGADLILVHYKCAREAKRRRDNDLCHFCGKPKIISIRKAIFTCEDGCTFDSERKGY